VGVVDLAIEPRPNLHARRTSNIRNTFEPSLDAGADLLELGGLFKHLHGGALRDSTSARKAADPAPGDKMRAESEGGLLKSSIRLMEHRYISAGCIGPWTSMSWADQPSFRWQAPT
jgi:hypothetical protein